jgi:hypothetical protein
VIIMGKTTSVQQVVTATDAAASGAQAEYGLAADVALVIVWNGSSRLIDLNGECYGLPEMSTKLLAIALQRGVDAAVREIALQYAVAAERVRADLEAFLGDLHQRGLLTRSGQKGSRAGLCCRAAAWALAGMFRFVLRFFGSDTNRAAVLLALSCITLKLLGWTKTIEVWQRTQVGRLQRASRVASSQAVEAIGQAVRKALSRSVFPVDCKARALCCWALLRSAGQPARVVVGIDLFPFLGHCWCESGTQVLADGHDRCGRFTPVLQYA